MRKTRAFFLDLLAQNDYICGDRKAHAYAHGRVSETRVPIGRKHHGKPRSKSQIALVGKDEKRHAQKGAPCVEVLSFPRRARHSESAFRLYFHSPQRVCPERHNGAFLHHLQRRHQSRPRARSLDGMALRPVGHRDGAQHPPLYRGIRGAGQEIRLQHLLLRHRLRHIHGDIQGR